MSSIQNNTSNYSNATNACTPQKPSAKPQEAQPKPTNQNHNTVPKDKKSDGTNSINTGPAKDTLTPSNNLFAHSQSSGTTAGAGPTAGSNNPPAADATASAKPDSKTLSSPTPSANTQSAGGNNSPNSNSPSSNSSSNGATPSSSTNGGNSAYATNMLSTLKGMNAPQSLIDAYKQQYQLLGMLPSDGSAPAGGNMPAGASTPASNNTPVGSDSTAPASGSAPTGSGSAGPATNGSSPSAGASPAPAGSSTPPAGGATPAAGGATPPASSGSSAPSGQGHMIGQIQATNPSKYDQQINDAIQKYGGGQKIDPNIIKGMIWQESKGDPMAAGSLDDQGSKGLLQVTGANVQQYGFGNQYDPAQSIGLGVKMYADALKNNNGDVAAALGEYNQGPGAKTSANAQTYAQKVQEWAGDFAQNPNQLPGGAQEGQLF